MRAPLSVHQSQLVNGIVRISSPRLSPTARRTVVMATSNFSSFPDPSASDFKIAIMGDLHLPKVPTPITQFEQARDQLVQMISDSATHRVVQLGDLGSYEKGWPGSRACFQRAGEFLDSFNAPVGLVLGNHDLEADEFETDEENMAAWQAAFNRKHYWSAELGPAMLIGLSTVRFRSNPFSVHEVHIDDEQLDFFEAKLKEAAGRPVVVFTHAPPMGCGLKVMQTVHVKNRCAWLNHSSDPKRFMRLVEQNPNVKLWFSGHFHLSQSYPDSISFVGSTAFVLTGVIGDNSSREGHRHSRLLKGTSDGFELYTVDHDDGSLRLDLKGRWNDAQAPEYMVPADELICDVSSGWLCSKVDFGAAQNGGGAAAMESQGLEGTKWYNAGPNVMLALMEDIVVEYDVATMSPIGAVFLDVPEGCQLRLLDGHEQEVDGVATDGSTVELVELYHAGTQEVLQVARRNDRGGFYQIWQPNKWVARKKREAEEAAALAKQQAVAA